MIVEKFRSGSRFPIVCKMRKPKAVNGHGMNGLTCLLPAEGVIYAQNLFTKRKS